MKNGVYFIMIALLVAELYKLKFWFMQIRGLARSQCGYKVMLSHKKLNICANAKSTGMKFRRIDVLQDLRIVTVVMTSPWQHTPYQASTFLKWKMPSLLLQSLTDFVMVVLCNVHIRPHALNEQQEQITLPEGRKLWFYPLNGGHMWCNNCTKFQFYAEKVWRDVQIFFVILHYSVSTLWLHKSSSLHKFKLE